MKAFKFIIFSVLFLLAFSACDKQVLPSDLVKYVANPDNGLHKTKSVGAINMDLQYKPLGYVIANEFRKNKIGKDEYTKRRSELDGLQYYNLKLSIDQEGKDVTNYQISNMTEQQQRLYYLSFGMQHDIKLVQGQDTLKPVLYHFERSYNLSDHRTFVVAFEEKDLEHNMDKTFVLDTPEFQTGPVKIKIQKDDLKNTPSLKLL